MRTQKQMALFGLGGGVALASAAFALGTQAGGGSAVAGTSTSSAPTTELAAAPAFKEVHLRGPGGEKPFGDLAERLGVDEAKLRAALEDLRPDRKDVDEHAAGLAKILKLDEAKVQAALEKVRPPRPVRGDHVRVPGFLVDELVEDLKLDEAKVRAAIEKVMPAPPPPPQPGGRPDKDALLSALADELGVDAAKVRESLSDVGRREHHVKRGPGGPHGPGGPISDELAKELGVSTAALEKAFETLHEQERAEFAKQLAAKLSISPDKVEEALRDMPHRGGRGHHR